MVTEVAEHPQSAMLADLARSGLTATDAKKLKLRVLTSDEMAEVSGKAKLRARAVEFPYFGVDGRDTGTKRYRFLDETRGFGEKKGQRYYQPPGTLPRAYFPPTRDWEKVAASISEEVWITEGEKKAAKACKEGLACIALGGVHSFASKKQGVMLLTELARFPWKNRLVKLCFDTDATPNPLVEAAEVTLVRRLEHLGATVSIVKLPLLKGEPKTGLDDFLVVKGRKALLAIEPQPRQHDLVFQRLNDELAIIENPLSVYHIPTGQLFSDPKPLIRISYAGLSVLAPDPMGQVRETNAVPEWLKWDGARRCERLVFEPGQPATTEANELNLWKPLPLQPRRGDVSLFRELIAYHARDLSEAHTKWWLQWFAHMFQRPGVKMYTAIVLWSETQGSGKTLLGETIGRLFGPYFGSINQQMLHGAFNGWQENRQFILGNEITGTERRQDADRIKDIITSDVTTINVKYKMPYQVRDCANYMFTSNRFNAFLLDREDRRFFVVHSGAGDAPPPEAWFAKKYDPWARSEEGQAALLYYLLHVDLEGFNPMGKAPVTVARNVMANASMSETEALATELMASPEQYLRIGSTTVDRDLFTVGELIQMLDPDRRYNLKLQMLSNALRKAGAVKLDRTRAPGSAGGIYLWAVRNVEKWVAAGHAERANHYAPAEAPAKF